MPYNGTLPPASIHGTWIESMELWSVDDNELADLSGVTEITLSLMDPKGRFIDLQLTLSDGSITIPSQGVIEWRAEMEHMGVLSTQLYEVLMQIEADGIVVPFVLGSISIVE